MIRITLAQMRASLGRLAAAGLAITIGTAFVAATLLAGDVMNRTGRDAVTATYAQADLVIDGEMDQAQLDRVRGVEGVSAADPLNAAWVQLSGPDGDIGQLVLAVPSDPRLGSLEVVDGRAPAADNEIALPGDAMVTLGVGVGDSVKNTAMSPVEDLTVVGEVADPRGAWISSGGAALATFDDTISWNGFSPNDVLASTTLIAVDGDLAATQDRLVAALADTGTGPDFQVSTRQEAADRALESLGSNGASALVSVVLAFAAVALLVAALVISNTFTVLIAQRTRRLALLRCVGASRAQLRGSVLLEATILGLAASAAGVLIGAGLTQAMLSVLRATVNVGMALPAAISITWPVVVVPVLVGTGVTVLASLVPARLATRVSPIEALRPVDAPAVGTGGGSMRLVFAALLTIGGFVGLAGSVALGVAAPGAGMLPLALGVLTGAASFVGVLVGAVFWVPPVVRLAGRLVARTGPAGRLAAANTVRNPRRTAATSTALLIGVTLVMMMSTGAATARSSLSSELDEQYPVDLYVQSAGYTNDGQTTPLPTSVASTVATIEGVAYVAPVTAVTAVTPDDQVLDLLAIDPTDAAVVLRDHAVAGALADGVVVAPIGYAEAGGTVLLPYNGEDISDANASRVQIEVIGNGSMVLTTPGTIAPLLDDAAPTGLFVALTPGADAVDTLNAVQEALGTDAVYVTGPAAERAQFDQVINVLLAVVVGLLGVAVVIALIGVTNTLSLSVIERRRESATLRAIGLSRRRLRWTLAAEGVLIALVGAVLGIGLGVVYGWAGAATVFGQMGQLSIAVPWRDVAIVVVVAVAAGLLASVLPGRAAARTSPVAALGVE